MEANISAAGNNLFDLSGQRVLVTGASSGIGRETAIVLSRLGAKVVLVARRPEQLNATLQQMTGSGHTIEVRNLNQYEEIPEWVRGVVEQGGELNGLVHAAGVRITIPLRMMQAAQTEELFRINVLAGLWLAKGFRQRGVRAAQGSLVFLASVAGLVGEAAVPAYAASKGAVLAMTKSLAVELARESIRVNCIAPGYVKTEMTAADATALPAEQAAVISAAHLLGLGMPVDVAAAVAYLLSPAARWVTGTTLIVDGGYTSH